MELFAAVNVRASEASSPRARSPHHDRPTLNTHESRGNLRMSQPLVRLSRRGAGLCCLVALLPVLLGPAGSTQAVEPRSIHTSAAEHTLGALGLTPQEGRLEITLEDAISIALQRNLGLLVERYERSRSALGIKEALGIYDLGIQVDLSASESTSRSDSSLEGVDSVVNERQDADLGLQQLTPFGGTVSLSFNNNRIAQNVQFATFNPSFTVNAGLSVTQPLLRNFGRLPTERNIIVARNNSAISLETFEQQVTELIKLVADTYWQLVESKEQLRVARESLELAKELDEMNRIQVEVGTLAPLETVRSEAGVATREEDIILRTAAVEDSMDRLRQLLNFEEGSLWEIELDAVTDPEIPHQPIDVEEAIETAIAERPELQSQRLTIESLSVDARVARNQKLPQLDLSASYGLNAVDGRRRQDGVIIFDNDYFDALDLLTDADFDSWSVGVLFRYPLQNRQAEAASVRADLALEQGEVQLSDLAQQVMTEVRRTARAVETAAKSIASAKVSSRLQLKNLEAEQKRYDNGISTSFEVLQIQEDLSEARSREVSAVTQYRQALTDYYRAIGQLIEVSRVELVDDAP